MMILMMMQKLKSISTEIYTCITYRLILPNLCPDTRNSHT